MRRSASVSDEADLRIVTTPLEAFVGDDADEEWHDCQERFKELKIRRNDITIMKRCPRKAFFVEIRQRIRYNPIDKSE